MPTPPREHPRAPQPPEARRAAVATAFAGLVGPVSLLIGLYLGRRLRKPRPAVADLDQTYAQPQPSSTPSATTIASAAPEARKAAITTIVAALLSPVSLLIGFYLGHALQRPHLSIADLDQAYYNESHMLSPELRTNLSAQPLVVSALRETIAHLRAGIDGEACVDWLDGKPWKDACIATVLNAANGLSTSLEAESQKPVPEMLKGLQITEEKKEAMQACLHQLIGEVGAMDTNTPARSGGLDLNVGVLNTGDFDGVVSKFATLNFSKGSFTILAEKFTVVKAHGFESIKFDANNPTSDEQSTYDVWKELVRTNSETPFELTLVSGDGKRIHYNTHLFK